MSINTIDEYYAAKTIIKDALKRAKNQLASLNPTLVDLDALDTAAIQALGMTADKAAMERGIADKAVDCRTAIVAYDNAT